MTAAADEHLLQRLQAHKALHGAPESELRWLVDHGEVISIVAGELLTVTGRPIEYLFIIFSGHIVFYTDRSTQRKLAEWHGGDLSGVMPYSRLQTSIGDAVCEESGELLRIPRSHFSELIQKCPAVTAACVHSMIDRARHFKATDAHDEKMRSLGKLSAGAAHELNNPASAAARGAAHLASRLEAVDRAARDVFAAGLNDSQRHALDMLRAAAMRPAPTTSPLERSDREDELQDWLDDHAVSGDFAPDLVETGVTLAELDEAAAILNPAQLEACLSWATSAHAARAVATEIERAASRIEGIVSAMKRFSYLDRALVPVPTDVVQGIKDTVTLLTAKARARTVSVTVETDPDIPQIPGFGGELNQVWSNLLDNAVDAVPAGGHVTIRARVQAGSLLVSFIDDGTGIPDSIKSQIYDPFFTTKPIGKGTGLGLDITRRIIQRHAGSIEVNSRPGRTEFCIKLPLVGPPVAEAAPGQI
jgi:signal transduction histidine kinase